MALNRLICTKNDFDYLSICKEMTSGARTVDELVELVGVCTECEGYKSE